MVDFTKLAAPFPAEAISWRVGAKAKDNTTGLALAYFDARDAQDRLDEICGPGGWQDDYPHAGQKTVCRVGIKIGDEWVWKANGAGDTDVEQEKGALSDAFKRACTMWGIGRYLYNFPNLWVKIKPQGKSYIIDPSEEPRLLKAMRDFMAGVKIPSNQPPPDADVLAAARRWVSDSKAGLLTMVNEADVRAWQNKWAKALHKLQGESEPLYGDIMKAYGDALDRTRREAA